jgi:hypothetical protein
VVAVHRVKRLRTPQRYFWIKRLRARAICVRDRVVVDRHRVIARNELHVGVFGRDNLAHAANPDRAVQLADVLHLEHQLVLSEGGILGLEPVQALRRADFLDIEKVEEVLEMVVPFALVRSYEGADGLRAPGVDIAEEAALDLVVNGRAKEGRIQIRLKESPGGRRITPRAVLGDHAPVGEDFLIRGHVDIGKRLPAGLEETLLIPLRDVVVVSRDRHRCDLLDIVTPQGRAIQTRRERTRVNTLKILTREIRTRRLKYRAPEKNGGQRTVPPRGRGREVQRSVARPL